MADPVRALQARLDRLLADDVLPGGVIARAIGGRIDLCLPFGDAVREPETIAATPETVYDTASLTKPLVTATLVLQLVDSGALGLETRLAELFDVPDDKASITIADLLVHASGIVDWYPLYTRGSSISAYRELILSMPLACPPRTQTIYSCPNYILLASVIEHFSGLKFAEAAERRLFAPLGLTSTWLGAPPIEPRRIAAGERDSLTERGMISRFGLEFAFREGMIWGETHDANSHQAGGSAGNAGLFTTVREAIALADEYGPRSRTLSSRTRALVGPNLTPYGPQFRTIGWQRGDSPGGSAGTALPSDAIGHTGFTGTSLWYLPSADWTIAIFTNRIHPEARPVDMNEIRRELHALIMDIPVAI
jgi:CubicO group peptidase (beta-lactamase class C family)